jgi:hypothetical protein
MSKIRKQEPQIVATTRKSATVVTTFPARSSIENILRHSLCSGSVLRKLPDSLLPQARKYSNNDATLSYLQPRLSSGGADLRFRQAMNGAGETNQCRAIEDEVDADRYANEVGAGIRPRDVCKRRCIAGSGLSESASRLGVVAGTTCPVARQRAQGPEQSKQKKRPTPGNAEAPGPERA